MGDDAAALLAPERPAPKKKRPRWVLPAPSAAATVLIATAVLQFGSIGARRLAVTEALQVPVEPPSAPPIVLGGGGGGASTAENESTYIATKETLERQMSESPDWTRASALAATYLHLAGYASRETRKTYLENALKSADKSIQLVPDSARPFYSSHAFYLKGLALEQANQFAEVEAPLREATNLLQNDSRDASDAWYALGLALQKQNKTGETIAALQKAVEIDTSNENACQVLASLLARRDPAAAKKHIGILNATSLSPTARAAVKQLQTAVAAGEGQRK
jgi:tetratricopeptide (TPR) repeat protein